MKNLSLTRSSIIICYSREMEDPKEAFVCNNCYQYIKSCRYKCKNCADFDLCSVCIAEPRLQGHDSSHPFIKTELSDALLSLSESETVCENMADCDLDERVNAQDAEADVSFLEKRLVVLDGITYFGFASIAISKHAFLPLEEIKVHIEWFVQQNNEQIVYVTHCLSVCWS